MRKKNELQDGIGYLDILKETINRLHKKWDHLHGPGSVKACCLYVLKIIRDPYLYTHPKSTGSHSEFFEWYWQCPDMTLDVLSKMRKDWENQSDINKVKTFIMLNYELMLKSGRYEAAAYEGVEQKLLCIEEATDGEISQAIDQYWKKEGETDDVKKTQSKGKEGSS